MKKKLLSLALIISMLIPNLKLPSAFAEEDSSVISIRTYEDLMQFINNCGQDSWSRDKTIVLENDIDMSLNDEYLPEIPVFSGTFDGNGHTLENIYIRANNNIIGLFEYVESDAVIKNLNVSIILNSWKNENNVIGGLVAVNAGIIENCNVKMSADENTVVGGIAAQNGKTGIIRNSTADGLINASAMVGGIAGINYGLITDCTNNAEINTGESWLDSNDLVLSLDLKELIENGEQMLSSKSDFGGIAGCNKGIIQNCVNKARIGYANNGSNVGGIAGRQMGTISGCSNFGRVIGKQEIGGIVGKLEPVTKSQEVENIKEYTSSLHDMVNKLVDDVKKAGDKVTGENTELINHVNSALSAADEMAVEGKKVANEDIDQINDLLGRMRYVIDNLSPILDQASASLNTIKEINDTVASIEGIIYGTVFNEKIQSSINSGMSNIKAKQSVISDNIALLKNKITSAEKLVADIKNGDLSKSITEVISDVNEAASAGMILIDSVNSIGISVREMAEILDSEGKNSFESLHNEFLSLNSKLGLLHTSLSEAYKGTKSVVSYLSSLEKISFTLPGESFDNNYEKFKTEIYSITDILNQINTSVKDDSGVISQDIKSINNLLNRISDILIQKYDEINDILSNKRVVEDGSDEADAKLKASMVIDCSNNGIIQGWSDVGGIVGYVATQEVGDDNNSDNFKLGTKYKAYAIIDSCNNYGHIVTKKKYSGGIAGRILYGKIENCFARGLNDAENIAGGIAGYSEGTIKNCDAMMDIHCYKVIGGIAGIANKVSGCHALAWKDDLGNNAGGIIGTDNLDKSTDISQYIVSSKSKITDNYYVNAGSNGIGNINIKGCAEEITYEELMNIPGINPEFGKLKLIFLTPEYDLIESYDIKYGDELYYSEPEVLLEERKKYVFLGSDYNDGSKAVSDIICTSVLYNSENVISYYQDMEVNNKEVYVSGDFSIMAEFEWKIDEDRKPDIKEGESSKTYILSLKDDNLDENADYPVRFFIGKDVLADAYQLKDGEWVLLESSIRGRYLATTMHTSSDIISIVTREQKDNTQLYIIIGICSGCGLVVIIIICIICSRLKKKKMRKA